ncbi:MAG: hypothetical protein K0U86_14030 [Planctomycetes bacterium]|nr:hypothetical protein [Planctomycetota bacterium]MCH9726013.1 hypothetical protein [Planctomycetota bacterium]MCH9777165.1 hypothetical protein [Planctomycetota bacterium]MCH9790853.1 hypothetical protein [Planctomycetota bacterium]
MVDVQRVVQCRKDSFRGILFRQRRHPMFELKGELARLFLAATQTGD